MYGFVIVEFNHILWDHFTGCVTFQETITVLGIQPLVTPNPYEVRTEPESNSGNSIGKVGFRNWRKRLLLLAVVFSICACDSTENTYMYQ